MNRPRPNAVSTSPLPPRNPSSSYSSLPNRATSNGSDMAKYRNMQRMGFGTRQVGTTPYLQYPMAPSSAALAYPIPVKSTGQAADARDVNKPGLLGGRHAAMRATLAGAHLVRATDRGVALEEKKPTSIKIAALTSKDLQKSAQSTGMQRFPIEPTERSKILALKPVTTIQSIFRSMSTQFASSLSSPLSQGELESSSSLSPVSATSTTQRPSPVSLSNQRRQIVEEDLLHTRASRADAHPRRSTPQDLAFKSQEKSRGLVGLVNLGNTCFLNSVLQCLSNVPPLTDFFTSNRWQKFLQSNSPARGQVAIAYAHLMARIWCSERKVDQAERPSQLKNAISVVSKRFLGCDQHDSQEFLRVVIESLHDDVNVVSGRKPYRELPDPAGASDEEVAHIWWQYHLDRENSRVSEIFAGQLHSIVSCSVCGHRSRAFDPFWDLSVPIPKKFQSGDKELSLIDCIECFVSPENLSGDDACYCQRCAKHQPSTKVMKLSLCPTVLVIHIKRFAFSTYRRTKISAWVEIPKFVDMGGFFAKEVSNSQYKLIGVVNHYGGGLQSGHYTADCLNRDDNSWYNFNDSRVSGSCRIDGSAAYLAFYLRCN